VKTGILVAVLIAIMFSAFIYIIITIPKPEYIQVDIHDLVEHPENYSGKYVNVTGWLGDTKELDTSTWFLPIFIHTDDGMIIIWVPISDTDYYFAVYKDNSFTKGIIIKLEHKRPELLGEQVYALGKVVSQKVKIEGETQKFWILKGDVHGIE
jgi:hypothetical protein